MPYIRRLVISFPLWRPGFDPRSSYVGFVVDKVARGQVFYEYFVFSCQFSFHQLLHGPSSIIWAWCNRSNSGWSTKWTQSHPTQRKRSKHNHLLTFQHGVSCTACSWGTMCQCGVSCTAHSWLFVLYASISWVVFEWHEFCLHILLEKGLGYDGEIRVITSFGTSVI
jgi:hypothetical protein